MSAAACGLDTPREHRIQLLWQNKFTWADVDTSAATRSLTGDEIELIKTEALVTLTAAFEDVGAVRISSGQQRAHDTIEVRNLGKMALGETDRLCFAGACPPSRVDYDLHMFLAQRYAAVLAITNHDAVMRAIGRGIGNTAVHEFGHRHRLIGMDQTTDPGAFTYSDDHPLLFYGARLQWPQAALADMRKKLD